MIDPSKKTIVFDFGNVLIDLDFEGCYEYFGRILGVDWSDRKLPESITKAIHRYNKGEIKDESMLWAFQQVNDKTPPRDLVKAWNSLVLKMPAHRFKMLASLKLKYNLVLLSNINNFHIIHIQKHFAKDHPEEDFESYFEHVFYSHIIGMLKPDNEIYSHVTDTTGINPSDILFLDDMLENIEAAQKLGWNAIQHNPQNDIAEMIDGYLQKVDFVS